MEENNEKLNPMGKVCLDYLERLTNFVKNNPGTWPKIKIASQFAWKVVWKKASLPVWQFSDLEQTCC